MGLFERLFVPKGVTVLGVLLLKLFGKTRTILKSKTTYLDFVRCKLK